MSKVRKKHLEMQRDRRLSPVPYITLTFSEALRFKILAGTMLKTFDEVAQLGGIAYYV